MSDEPTPEQLRDAWLLLIASILGIFVLLWAAWAQAKGLL